MPVRETSGERALRVRARASGVVDRYVDGLGVKRIAPTGVLRALLEAIGDDERRSNQVVVARANGRAIRLRDAGAARGAAALALEDGGEIEGRIARDSRGAHFVSAQRIPLGVHQLRYGRKRSATWIMASPRTLSPQVSRMGREIAAFIPLYAVNGQFGVGTTAELDRLTAWAARTTGGFVGTLPLYPAFIGTPHDPSPYAPVSRMMWGELFADVARSPEYASPPVKRLIGSSAFQNEVAKSTAGTHVDYKLSWALQRRVLESMSHVARRHDARWRQISALAGPEAIDYARFRATVEQKGVDWRQWRSHPIRRADPRAVDLYVYAQALLNEQMAQLGRARNGGSSLYLDLPIGVHAGGYDTWRWPELFLHGVSAGAPPDGLYAAGQTWGFPPSHPTAGRADGYAYFRGVLRKMMSAAGVVRIDHVMGLHRMYCIPPGFPGDCGAYLRYPHDELYAALMIEAARSGAVVVGEDLGTVPETARREMRRRGVLGMHVQQFGFSDQAGRSLSMPSAHQLACLNTHDTPTFSGYWYDADIELRQRLGMLGPDAARGERAWRTRVRRAVRRDVYRTSGKARPARDVARAIMRLQARSGAPLLLVNIEDLWDERQPQNVPGTTDAYPNWRRRSLYTARRLVTDAYLASRMRELARDRAGSRKARTS